MGTELTFVFDDFGNHAWFTDELFDETDVTRKVMELGVGREPARRTRHLRFALSHPLTLEQEEALRQLQDLGLFRCFFMSNTAGLIETVEATIQRAVAGDRDAAIELRQLLATESNPTLLQAVFTPPLLNKERDARSAFFLPPDHDGQLSILPLLQQGKLQGCVEALLIWAKALIEQTQMHGDYARGSVACLASLLSPEEMITLAEHYLSIAGIDISILMQPLYGHSDVLTKIWNEVHDCLLSDLYRGASAEKSEEMLHTYEPYATELYLWFLEHPHHSIARSILSVWEWLIAMAAAHKKAVTSGETEDAVYSKASGYHAAIKLSCEIKPHGAELLRMLERFEQGMFVPSDESATILKLVADLLRFRWTGFVEVEETQEDPPAHRVNPEAEELSDKKPSFPIDGLLGSYLPYWNERDILHPEKGHILLFMTELHRVASYLGIEVNILKRVVTLHEAAHALVHLGIDADGKRFSTKEFQQVDAGADPSPLQELLAQLFCYHAVKNDAAVLACFIRLGEYQPETYTSWQLLKDHSLEQVRTALVRMRHGEIEPTYTAFVQELTQ